MIKHLFNKIAPFLSVHIGIDLEPISQSIEILLFMLKTIFKKQNDENNTT